MLSPSFLASLALSTMSTQNFVSLTLSKIFIASSKSLISDIRLTTDLPEEEERKPETFLTLIKADSTSDKPATVRKPVCAETLFTPPLITPIPGAEGTPIATAASTIPDKILYSLEPG